MPEANDSSTALARARTLLQAYRVQSAGTPFYQLKADCCEAGRELLAETADVRMWAVVESVRGSKGLAISPLRSALLRKELPFTEEAVLAILKALLDVPHLYQNIAALIGAVENFVAEHGLSEPLREYLVRLGPHLAAIDYAGYRKAAQRVDRLLETDGVANPTFRWSTDEAWVEHLRGALDRFAPAARDPWSALLLHCQAATSSKPTKTWMKQAGTLLEAIGKDAFAALTIVILEQIGKPARTPPPRQTGLGDQTDPTLIHDAHSDLLRGLIWSTSLVEDERLVRAVGRAADCCFQKIPWIGQRSPKIGNACLFALSQQSTQAGVAELSRLKTRVKHASTRKQLGKSLDAVADRAGMSAVELEEISVPTFGLTAVGEQVGQLGEVTFRLSIGPEGNPQLMWQPAGRKPQAAVPAALKESHPLELKSIQQSLKEIGKLLIAQRIRLERLFLQQASWMLPEFRARYLDHPLVGTLARRLIWRFEFEGRSTEAIWYQGRLVGPDGNEAGGLNDQTRVALWHPIATQFETVRAWRNWLETHEVRQPFKQAHREIYLLTDAERRTETYSHRFAAHILRQHQFAALSQERGWRYRLQGRFDSAATPTLELPQWNLSAEYWVQPVAAETSAMGIFLYLSSDQVRFLRGLGPLPLEQVPPLVFSEVMRDVDLFVGVTSLGSDPNWTATAGPGQLLDYWNNYSLGELSATALTRKAVLERVIPRLKIGARCSFLDRYLVVRGERKTYKIHLGSANVFMSPDNQYLCIVPDRSHKGDTDRVFLPFEGDQTLSIILSKAFLLADDSRIKDPTILRQLGG
jgi:hypothetical protein